MVLCAEIGKNSITVERINMKTSMIYAPVIIPTLCRAEKLKDCIESLQRNHYAQYTELYISLDYPPNESYRQGYEQVKEYLGRGIEGFSRVEILEQKSNQGWHGNYDLLRKKVYEKHNCYIFSEDDNVFSRNFLEYMDRCLTEFEQDEEILAVTGYSYPIDWMSGNNNVVKIDTYFAAWGFGIWREKEEKMLRAINLQNFEGFVKNGSAMRKLYCAGRNQYCNFIKGMIEYTDMLIEDGQVLALDLSFALYQIFYGKYMIFPTVSKVRNMGYGEGGVHCGELIIKEGKPLQHRNYPYAYQPIDESDKFDHIVYNRRDDGKCYHECMENFFTISSRELIFSKLAAMICRLGGRKYLATLVRRLRKVNRL